MHTLYQCKPSEEMSSSEPWRIYRFGVFVLIGLTATDLLLVTLFTIICTCLGSRSLARNKQSRRIVALSLAIVTVSLALTISLAVSSLLSDSEAAVCSKFAVADKVLLALLATLSSYFLTRSWTTSFAGSASWPFSRSRPVPRGRVWHVFEFLTPRPVTSLYLCAILLLETICWLAWIVTTRSDCLVEKSRGDRLDCVVYIRSKTLLLALSCSTLSSAFVMLSLMCTKSTRKQWRTLLPASIGGFISFILRALTFLAMLLASSRALQQLALVATTSLAASASRVPMLLSQLLMDEGDGKDKTGEQHFDSQKKSEEREKPRSGVMSTPSVHPTMRGSLPDTENAGSCFSRPATALSWGGIKPAWSPIHPLQAASRSRHQSKPSSGIPQDVSSPSVTTYKVTGKPSATHTPETMSDRWPETYLSGDLFPFIHRQRTRSGSINLDREPPKRKNVPALEDGYWSPMPSARKSVQNDGDALPNSVTPNLAQTYNMDDEDRSIYSKQSAFAESAVIDYLQRDETTGARSRTTSLKPPSILGTGLHGAERDARSSFASVRDYAKRRQTSVGSGLIYECKPSTLSVDSSELHDNPRSFLAEHNLTMERPRSRLSIHRLMRTSTKRKVRPISDPCVEDDS